VWLTPHLRDLQPEGERESRYFQFRLLRKNVLNVGLATEADQSFVYSFLAGSTRSA